VLKTRGVLKVGVLQAEVRSQAVHLNHEEFERQWGFDGRLGVDC
jgi:hypothetical protein